MAHSTTGEIRIISLETSSKVWVRSYQADLHQQFRTPHIRFFWIRVQDWALYSHVLVPRSARNDRYKRPQPDASQDTDWYLNQAQKFHPINRRLIDRIMSAIDIAAQSPVSGHYKTSPAGTCPFSGTSKEKAPSTLPKDPLAAVPEIFRGEFTLSDSQKELVKASIPGGRQVA